MAETARLGLPLIAAAQAQKHVTHNEALAVLDGLVPGVVASATTATAPATPAEGDAYIVPPGGSFGTVTAGQIAIHQGGIWHAVPSTFGQKVFVLDEGRHRINGGGLGWRPGQTIGALGGSLGVQCLDSLLDLSLGGTQVTASALIPARSIVLGVTSWTATAVSGPAAYKVGDGATLDRFGGSLGTSAGSSNIGVVGPFAVYSDTDVTVSAQDDATPFTSGTVGLSALILAPGPAPV